MWVPLAAARPRLPAAACVCAGEQVAAAAPAPSKGTDSFGHLDLPMCVQVTYTGLSVLDQQSAKWGVLYSNITQTYWLYPAAYLGYCEREAPGGAVHHAMHMQQGAGAERCVAPMLPSRVHAKHANSPNSHAPQAARRAPRAGATRRGRAASRTGTAAPA